MLNRIITDKIFCGLDIGAQKIKAGALKLNEQKELELIGLYESPIYGFNNCSVTSLSDLSECIHANLNGLASKAQIKVKDVQLGIGGDLIKSRGGQAVIPLVDRGHKVITSRDIKHVNEQARLLGTKMDEEILHDLPQNYEVDDVNSALNPLGLYGRKLAVRSISILADANRMRNIVKAVNQAGFDVSRTCFSSYAAAEVALQEESRQRGCILIDLGARTTNVLIFKDNVLQSYDKVAFGGENLTRAIVKNLKISPAFAEEIKRSYVVALESERHQEEEILVKQENEYKPIRRCAIYEAIQEELETLLDQITAVVECSHMRDYLTGGVYAIGGGALLSGLMERIESSVNLPVQLGKVQMLSHKNVQNTALYAPVIGLACGAYKNTFGYSVSNNEDDHWTARIVTRMRELYQEYF